MATLGALLQALHRTALTMHAVTVWIGIWDGMIAVDAGIIASMFALLLRICAVSFASLRFFL